MELYHIRVLSGVPGCNDLAVGALQLLALELLLRRSTLELRDLLQLLSFGSFQLDTLSSWALELAAVDAVRMTKTLQFGKLCAIT